MSIEASANPQLSPIENLKVAVLYGGIGSERQVSIESGKCVAEAIKRAGIDVKLSDISPSDLRILDDGDIDVFFLALHGKFGEDGKLQQILEDKSLVYTGSGPEASRLGFDKMASKKALIKAGINVPAAMEFSKDITIAELEERLHPAGDKYVVKPVTEGSSVGISIVTGSGNVIEAARKTADEFGNCMIEEFIEGREVTVGILVGEALPIIEIRPAAEFYNYYAKYNDEQTEYLFDTVKDQSLQKNIKEAAIKCFNALGLKDFARVDFILSADGKAYVLEANTIPGFTSHSLLPKAAAKVGYSMSEMCVKIIEAAVRSAGCHAQNAR